MTDQPKKKPINSRAKGIACERQLCNLLSEALGFKVHRNWNEQSAKGGYDIEGLTCWAPESKAVNDKGWSPNVFWKQTVSQAANSRRLPVLCRKVPLKGWECYLPLALLLARRDLTLAEAVVLDDIYCDFEQTARVPLSGFVTIMKTTNLI